mmetsp:Transcript_53585/g.149045  ORF Transcript_53585/g.149045 Transcript_53585/m.149045 type:complete len:338 (+) Transcript_53585:80-1093(+)|eukprot:CAMPEP_0117533834 /NCGR_PEP_ID=MMETSP0784-20121206/40100_1 /TAXON_ID=39447 /ORGANISM="" /LENGTH=337 /DNA_ID=CAMNT_0005330295 /DNA_START=13 /DNA_END=1026 /DNA_ORIENTATION=-
MSWRHGAETFDGRNGRDPKIECYKEVTDILRRCRGKWGYCEGEQLRRTLASPFFSDEAISYQGSTESNCYDHCIPTHHFEWGGYCWSGSGQGVYKGMHGKTLRDLVEEKIPGLLPYLAVKVITIRPERGAEGMTLTCTNMAGDVIATFEPSKVRAMDAYDFRFKLANAQGIGSVVLVLPDGSRMPEVEEELVRGFSGFSGEGDDRDHIKFVLEPKGFVLDAQGLLPHDAADCDVFGRGLSAKMGRFTIKGVKEGAWYRLTWTFACGERQVNLAHVEGYVGLHTKDNYFAGGDHFFYNVPGFKMPLPQDLSAYIERASSQERPSTPQAADVDLRVQSR